MNESDTPLQTRPVRPEERFMQERFTEAIANQSKQMDTLAQQLLVIELAIPGLYATSLKLVSGTEKTEFSLAIAIAFGCWFIALIFIIFAITPRQYKDINRNSTASIEAFFDNAAGRKLSLLMPSLALFVVGITAILWDLFT
jgi:nitrogen fixation-related uncharacterized protein